jgi:hypothetical protein
MSALRAAGTAAVSEVTTVRYDQGKLCHTCVRRHPGLGPPDGMIFNLVTKRWHHGEEYGITSCGKDATGPRWWWPL